MRGNRKTFGFDIDDVLFDFWETGIKIFNEKYGVNASKKDFVRFDSMNDIYNIDYPEFLKTVIEEGVLEQMKPYRNVPKVMQSISEMGHEIVLITSRDFHPDSFNVTKDCLDKHEMPFDRLYIKEKGKTKADYINSGMHSFLDDLPLNLEDIKQSNKVEKLILIDQPWNKSTNSFIRNRSLKEFYDRYIKNNYSDELSI